MFKVRHLVVVLGMLLYPLAPATAEVNIGIGFPNVSIGINLPFYPDLIQVPDYPVYYAPRLDANYFFYDGMYWVFQNDNWYASDWYNGPWEAVDPYEVPVYLLRIPVRYYRQPPAYFRGWRYDAPPRWGDHWGRGWEQRRSGWDRWNRGAAPAPAPLPLYQRQYSGDRYPRQVEQQHELNRQNYRYQPNDPVVRQYYQARPVQAAPVPVQRRNSIQDWRQRNNPGTQGTQRSYSPPAAPQRAPQNTNPWQQGNQRSYSAPAVPQGPSQNRNPYLQGNQRSSPPPAAHQKAPTAPYAQPPQQGGGNVQRSAPTQAPPQQKGTAVQSQSRQPPQQGAAQHQQQMPASQGREEKQKGKAAKPEPKQGQDQGQDQDQHQGQEHGRDRNE
jgi:hypothetical protein